MTAPLVPLDFPGLVGTGGVFGKLMKRHLRGQLVPTGRFADLWVIVKHAFLDRAAVPSVVVALAVCGLAGARASWPSEECRRCGFEGSPAPPGSSARTIWAT
ncbi:MAG TPA: hypothetical protein VEJ84_04275 [Acidimicrobiales bacterium]|nr:hypothetical protein [Acidimicrobiales bacterium]